MSLVHNINICRYMTHAHVQSHAASAGRIERQFFYYNRKKTVNVFKGKALIFFFKFPAEMD